MAYNLEQKFQEAERGTGPGYLRVTAVHAVDLFVGVDDGRRSILLVCDREPPRAQQFEAISVQSRRREDGRWALLVSLERPSLATLFSYLAEDLVLVTEREQDCYRASVLLVERLKWWQRLLSSGRTGVLGDAELRGLVGELLFLRDCAIPILGPSMAVRSWVGPFDAPRDFRFDDVDVEVKAIARDAKAVNISSLEQLEPSGVPIVLSTVILESVAEGSQSAWSVRSIVGDVRARCEPTASIIGDLSERLWAVGYVDSPEYEKVWFRSKGRRFFACAEEFPKLVSNVVPAGVVRCAYQIDLDSIEKFSIPDWRPIP